jgi:FAD/FMN-containing dehydrogenase
VAGYTLGGGLGWYSRAYGRASDAVRSFDVVHADGSTARVGPDSDPELFWALRGGGGGLAVVTAVEFDLFPVAELYGGRMLWPQERAEEVLSAFLGITAGAPRELSVWFSRLAFPGAPPMVALDTAFLGGAEEGRQALRALDGIGDVIADRRTVLPSADLGSITAEPLDPSPGRSRGELLTGLDDAAAKFLLTAPADPMMLVQIRHLGGALDHLSGTGPDGLGSGPTALAGEPYLLYSIGVPTGPEADRALADRQREWVRGFGSAVSGRKPYTFLGADDTVENAFSGADLARLRGIKAARDPHGLLRSAFPLEGAGAGNTGVGAAAAGGER